MSDHASHGPTGGGEGFWGKPIRNTAVTGAGTVVGLNALGNNTGVAGGGVAAVSGAVAAVGDGVHSVLQLGGSAFASVAAPFATAAGALYLTNNGLDMIGVNNIIARRTAQAASILGGITASTFAPAIVGGAVGLGAAKLLWVGGKKLSSKMGISGNTAHT